MAGSARKADSGSKGKCGVLADRKRFNEFDDASAQQSLGGQGKRGEARRPLPARGGKKNSNYY